MEVEEDSHERSEEGENSKQPADDTFEDMYARVKRRQRRQRNFIIYLCL